MTMIATGDEPVAAGDVVTVFGGLVSLDAQARSAGTIAYELLTSLGARLPRRYAGAT
jgi:alanine racemase